MLRVLHVVGSMNRGGLETFIMNVYRQIDKSKIQFDFLVHTTEEGYFDKEIIALGGNIFTIPSRKDGIVKNRIALNSFFKKNHSLYDIVHQHASSLSYIEPLISAKCFGVKTRILHSHSSSQSGSKVNIIAHKLNMLRVKSIATHYFACSDFAAKWLFGEKIAKNNSYTIINNGIDLNKFSYNNQIKINTRKKLGIRPETKVIGHIGQMSYPKNHSFLIKIFKDVLSYDDDCILVLVGNGNLRMAIEEKIKKYDLEKKVIMLGQRSDINDLLNAMDIFVFPSIYEGLPVTLVEAQATGLKCIVSSNITKQIGITDLVTYCELSENSMQWAKTINNSFEYTRENKPIQIKKSKFDIVSVTEYLSSFYLNFEKI